MDRTVAHPARTASHARVGWVSAHTSGGCHARKLRQRQEVGRRPPQRAWPSLSGGEVDHPGQQLRPTTAVGDRELADVVPHVLIDAGALHAAEPCLVVSHLLQQRADRGPHGVPRRAELACNPADRGVLATHLVDRPPACPRGQQRSRPGHLLVLLSEDPRGAGSLFAAPGPLAPHQPHRPVEARCVDQRDVAATVAVRDHATGRAAHRRTRRLNANGEQSDVVVVLDRGHVQVAEADEQIASGAVRGVVIAARSRVRRRLGQRRGLPVGPHRSRPGARGGRRPRP